MRIRKTKTCVSCHRRKPLTEYHRCKAYRDGLYRRCKACSALSRRQRYLRNREQVLEQYRAYYAARREEICAKKKAWNKANQKYCQEYYRRNRERMLEYGRNIGRPGRRDSFTKARGGSSTWLVIGERQAPVFRKQ